jgi:hypothetical protein
MLAFIGLIHNTVGVSGYWKSLCTWTGSDTECKRSHDSTILSSNSCHTVHLLLATVLLPLHRVQMLETYVCLHQANLTALLWRNTMCHPLTKLQCCQLHRNTDDVCSTHNTFKQWYWCCYYRQEKTVTVSLFVNRKAAVQTQTLLQTQWTWWSVAFTSVSTTNKWSIYLHQNKYLLHSYSPS